MLLASLATGVSQRVADNPDIPADARKTIVAKAEEGIDIVPADDVEQAAVDGGLTQDQAVAVATDYEDAQLEALRLALGVLSRLPHSCRSGSRRHLHDGTLSPRARGGGWGWEAFERRVHSWESRAWVSQDGGRRRIERTDWGRSMWLS